MNSAAFANSLRTLLVSQRTATLGTLGSDDEPSLSRVAYAPDARQACFIVHLSSLAAHSGHLLRHARASMLVAEAERSNEPVHALPRIAIDVVAEALDASGPLAHMAKAVYLARFPEAEPMTQFGDFRFFALKPLGARQVAGFGSARNLSAADVIRAMGETA